MKASIEKIHGVPTVMIDGEPCPPMALTAQIQKPEYLQSLRKSGIRVFFVMANTNWLRPGGIVTDENGEEKEEKSGFESFQIQAEKLLSAVPDAYIIVRLGMHPPVSWMEENPDELFRYSDGSLSKAVIASEVHKDVVPGAYSLCSEKWRTDGTKALFEFCDMADTLPYADRIIGYFLGAGGTSEWYYVNGQLKWETGAYGDCSPAFRKEYGKILREKYKTGENLRKAWRREDASFENPIIPTVEERQYSHADGKIIDAMYYHESAGRMLDRTIDSNPHYGSNIGVFLNADSHQHVADYYQAWHLGTANSIVHFGKAFKGRYSDKLIGAFYGSYGCTNYFDLGTAGGTLALLDACAVDFLASPGMYNNREPGGHVAQRQMQDSFRLRNQLFVAEEDSRTHLESDFYRDAMGMYKVEDAINTLKRDFGRNLCEDTWAWWFDQHEKSGRYEHPDIYALFQKQQAIANAAFAENRTKNTEIALIYDQQSIHYVSQYTSDMMLDFYRTSDLARIGAPVDYYFHDDMARPDMPDYKLYVMINVFCLTDSEREAIHKKAAQNGAVIAWLYAPGFINPEAEKRIHNANIEDTVGMKIGRVDDTLSPRFRLIKADHPALRYGDRDRLYGYIDRPVRSNVWLGGQTVMAPFMNPGFYIDDEEAEILGRYAVNDWPAMALKKQPGGWTSVYCAPHILRSELLASLAEYAGCHLYNTDEDTLYANNQFVTLHSTYTGTHTLCFPKKCSPFEVYEGKTYGENVESIELFLHVGETKMFRY